jgi:hypothetical protein
MFEPRDHQVRLGHKYAFSVWQPSTSCLKTSELAFGANTLVWCANAPVWCANAPGTRSAGSKTFTVFVLPLAESTSSLSHRRGIAGLVIDDFCIIPQRLSSRGRVGNSFQHELTRLGGQADCAKLCRSIRRCRPPDIAQPAYCRFRRVIGENSRGNIRKASLWMQVAMQPAEVLRGANPSEVEQPTRFTASARPLPAFLRPGHRPPRTSTDRPAGSRAAGKSRRGWRTGSPSPCRS